MHYLQSLRVKDKGWIVRFIRNGLAYFFYSAYIINWELNINQWTDIGAGLQKKHVQTKNPFNQHFSYGAHWINCLKIAQPFAMLDTLPIRIDKQTDCAMFCFIFKTVCLICWTVCPIVYKFVQSAVSCVQSFISLSNLLWVVSNLPWVDQICFVQTHRVPRVPFSGALPRGWSIDLF